MRFVSLCPVLLTLLLWHAVALGAVQGLVGPSSSANVEITLTSNLNARITGLNDIVLGSWPGAGDLAGDDDLCIGRNGVGFFANGLYRIRASGDGDAADVSAFTLSNGTDTLYYNVFFNDVVGLGGRQPLTAGVTLTTQSSLGLFQWLNLLFGCAVPNANVSVIVPDTQLRGATSGTYAGTLTLVLIPD